MSNDNDLIQLLESLKIQHRDLDDSIEALVTLGGHDALQIKRLKKQKLNLKDRISSIKNQIYPDIIA
jgi:hypothetical protein